MEEHIHSPKTNHFVFFDCDEEQNELQSLGMSNVGNKIKKRKLSYSDAE